MTLLRPDIVMTVVFSLSLAGCEPPGADEFLAGEVALAKADAAVAAAHNCGADAVRTLPSNSNRVNVWVTEPISNETLNCIAEWMKEGPT
jgi:hypothetical protein